jgi:hypothetical protein
MNESAIMEIMIEPTALLKLRKCLFALGASSFSSEVNYPPEEIESSNVIVIIG